MFEALPRRRLEALNPGGMMTARRLSPIRIDAGRVDDGRDGLAKHPLLVGLVAGEGMFLASMVRCLVCLVKLSGAPIENDLGLLAAFGFDSGFNSGFDIKSES
ncbi:hypothetical protein BASA81_013184 [Batrachochytrium salamandrivorans]|nr:hypothetical protein BASA81_013184 [Batrachochytrium salamandrivorans]